MRPRLAVKKTTILSGALALALAVAGPAAQAQTFNLLYGFTGGADGGGPTYATLDPAGNLYGVAANGGAYNIDSGGYEWAYGTLFKVNQKGAQTVLHTFTGGADGAGPISVIRDQDGNLYGTTFNGGDLGCASDSEGCGVVFKFDKGGGFSVLHAFTGAADGQLPIALVQDSAGNLYGTTLDGGQYGSGVLFKIDVKGHETVLHAFTGESDGMWPDGNLLLDSSGNLYGTTEYYNYGGGYGTVFKFNLTSGTLTTLHSFTYGGTGGIIPTSLVMDSSGNLYGSTYGNTNPPWAGTLYKITPAGVFSVVHAFTGGKDGGTPWGSLALDAAGNLYGTTYHGGLNDSGVAFRVNLSSGRETVLHSFLGFADGGAPEGVVMDEAGDIYGTTGGWGPFVGIAAIGTGGGTVFKITP